MKIKMIETHKFAPELNRALVNGTWMPCPGIASIKDFRARYFRPQKCVITATVTVKYPEHLKWLDREYTGTVKKRKEALRFFHDIQKKLAPSGVATVKTYLVG